MICNVHLGSGLVGYIQVASFFPSDKVLLEGTSQKKLAVVYGLTRL